MAQTSLQRVRGKLLEIGAPESAGRDWIFQSLEAPHVHVPLGCRTGPPRALFDADELDLWRGDTVVREHVRYHLLTRLADLRPIGFFVDFGRALAVTVFNDPNKVEFTSSSPQQRLPPNQPACSASSASPACASRSPRRSGCVGAWTRVVVKSRA